MTVKELRTIAKTNNIKGYSRMNKAELLNAIQDYMAKDALLKARANAREELGANFQKAMSFWKNVKGNKMVAEDYIKMVETWQRLMSFVFQETFDDCLMETAEVFRNIYMPAANIEAYTDEELKLFIKEHLNKFVKSVFTERITKETGEQIKLTYDDISFDKYGNAYFDSRKASKFTAEEVKFKSETMKQIQISESGIIGLLLRLGLSHVSINMGKKSNDQEEMANIKNVKRHIFRHGVTDIANGKHYMFAFQSASATRSADYTFAEAQNWNDVVQLWLKITALNTWDSFKRAFFDKEGKCNLAKTIARFSMRTSNSFNLSKISPFWAKKIAQLKVQYFKDAEISIDRPYKTLTTPNTVELKESSSRNLVLGDGQMIGSYDFHALVAVALRIISENDYSEFQRLWTRAKKDINNVKEGTRLHSLLTKIPTVIQIRHGEKKGISIVYNIEPVKELNGAQILIPDSVRKFIGGEWSEYPLEICNYLKEKDNWVALNPQFIEALDFENPNALNPVAGYWIDKVYSALEKAENGDTVELQELCKVFRYNDDAEENLGDKLRHLLRNKDLANDGYTKESLKKQINKLVDGLKIGKILVPGQYTYMICDPARIINEVFKTSLPELASGEYYFNGKECRCGLFRSPLIHPGEVLKVNLSDNPYYHLYRNIIIFNGYDGAWDNMGGADFDGDICAVIPEDSWQGEIIVNAIRNIPYDIWEPAQSAQKVEFTMDNLIDYLVNSATPDRTGEITNFATRQLNVANHLQSAVRFAKLKGCKKLVLIHPQQFGTEGVYGKYGSKYAPQIKGDALYMKGFVEAKYDSKTNSIKFADTGLVGEFNLEDIISIADGYLDTVAILRILQGREIDGAKTGVYAEGTSGEDFTEEVKVKFTPHVMLTRQRILKKPENKNSELNEFISLAPMGRIHDYVNSRENEIYDILKSGRNKIMLLQSLLKEEEVNLLNTLIDKKTLLDVMEDRKKEYNLKVHTIMDKLSKEEETLTLKELREYEIEELYKLANTHNLPLNIIAVASYIATYTKDNHQNQGLSYAWLLFDELLAVFSRNNKQYELFKFPQHAENAYIKNDYLYINGVKHSHIDADDCEVEIQTFDGRPYGLIHKRVMQVAEARKSVATNAIYTLTLYGFQYKVSQSKEGWKDIVRQNNYEFDIILDDTNSAVTAVNGQPISVIGAVGMDYALVNKRVKLVNDRNTNPFDEKKASIQNVQVMIVAELN